MYAVMDKLRQRVSFLVGMANTDAGGSEMVRYDIFHIVKNQATGT